MTTSDAAPRSSRRSSPAPANRHATPATAQVLQVFHDLRREGRVLSGQFTNFGRRADLRLPRAIARRTGRWPGLIGVDYADFSIRSGARRSTQWLMNAVSRARFDLVREDGLSIARANRTALRYWQAGGLVTVGVHFTNPANPHGGGLRDREVDVAALLRRGPTRQRWFAQLDAIADGLAQLRDAGVVVLWRPFHEVNGDWFWWGKPAPAVFHDIWQELFEHYSTRRQLDNLLWVYSPVSGPDAHLCYPGDRFVDLVGLDAYTNAVNRDGIAGYPALARTGKPFGLSEFGPHSSFNPPGDFDFSGFVPALQRDFPRACYFMAWNANWSPVHNRNARSLFRHPAVANRDEVSRRLQSLSQRHS